MHSAIAELCDAVELVNYQQQPKQMPAAASGKQGQLRLVFSVKGRRSILNELYRVAPLLVQQALYWDDAIPDLPICSIISIGGGVLQGDRYYIDICVDTGASAQVNSQGANRIHQMDANFAAQYQSFNLAPQAYLEFLPDFTIPYKNSRYLCQTDILIDPSATLLYSEMVMLGRKHHAGERMAFDLLSLQTSVQNPQGKTLYKEKILIEPHKNQHDFTGQISGFDGFANVLCLTPITYAKQIMQLYQAYFAKDKSVFAAVSELPNEAGVILRVVGVESYLIREQVIAFWQVVRQVVKQKNLPSKFIWC